ncbi:hypothetical protein TNIN_126781 [Trichonephila inaurata madagascariensis]|uniref:Uncharacterized protein n=1 Tax=Trichonephila inaurata madagascariensis TaxID=2747483 RepID=A0A8X7CLZ3_9ARAC|nr:hypothetical protein TNIN_126761 [Trichonephila inaurata madagascariensis]GFY68887.1 hypothetical protein TNIN_126781 [Trichonephila inaurata madagascariensis]
MRRLYCRTGAYEKNAIGWRTISVKQFNAPPTMELTRQPVNRAADRQDNLGRYVSHRGLVLHNAVCAFPRSGKDAYRFANGKQICWRCAGSFWLRSRKTFAKFQYGRKTP